MSDGEYREFMNDIGDYQKAQREAEFAEKRAFSRVKRMYFGKKSDEYVAHVMRVARATLDRSNHEVTTIAVLHAVLEDSIMSFDEVKGEFGVHAAQCVETLTRGGKEIDEYYNALYEDYYAINIRIIKVCDLLEHEGSAELAEEAQQYLIPYMRKYEKNKMYIEYLGRIEEAIAKGSERGAN